MPTKTDPARELSDLIRSLRIAENQRLDHGLAQAFAVEVWSTDFYHIIFNISSRIDDLKNLTDEIDLDDDQKTDMKNTLLAIQQAFAPSGLKNTFSVALQHYFSPTQVIPLSILSGMVRPMRSYPKFDENEEAELIKMVDDLISWLNDHQLSEQDFIRQALLEGLFHLQFRLKRIKWLGWGYTLSGLREVIMAYFALERGFCKDGSNPPAEAMMKYVNDFVQNFAKKAGVAKEIFETGDFMLKAYGEIHLLLAGQTTVAGLLTYRG